MLLIALLLLAAALGLFWWVHRRQKALGLPGGRVIYADTQRWGPVEEPLYDASLGLTGRPDYVVRQGNGVIPVEVKSSQVADGPYDAHIYQLAAYCKLVEHAYGKRPPYGILHYTNRTYAIDFTPQLESALLDLLARMRAQERRTNIPRSHTQPARCRGCGYRSICDQRLK